jgi:zinc transport system ATP-binding protein
MKALLDINNVSKTYRGRFVLEDLEFKLYSNQIALLMGPNGAGKSTLARLLLGIEKPSFGSITRSKQMRFGYLPQRVSLNTSMSMSVLSVIKLIGRSSSVDQGLLKSLNILDLLHEQIANLSGGQLQKVLIAASVVAKPDFLVLDEPMHGLDVESQDELHSIIQKLRSDFEVSVLLISHDLRAVVNYADQILCLNKRLRCHSEGDLGKNNDQDFAKLSIYHHEH